MSFQNEMRKYMQLTERGVDGNSEYERPYDGHPDVKYSTGSEKGAITKVTATLSSFMSGKYTKLAQNIARMQTIAQETLELQKEIKDDGREAITDLFHAEDAAYTRVVETVSFVLSLTKDPKAATTVKYESVLNELESHLTPELLKVLASIKAKYSTIQTPKAPSLKYSVKDGGVGVPSMEGIEYNKHMVEGPGLDKMKSFFSKYLNKILSWGQSYDTKLDGLKAIIADENSFDDNAVHESIKPFKYTPNQVANYVWDAIMNGSESGHNDISLLGHSAKGGTMSLRTPDNSTFEISIKQIK